MKTSRIWVYSGARPSNGAKELAAQIGFLRLRDGRFHKIRPNDIVINWGISAVAHLNTKVLNTPNGIQSASNKLSAFKKMSLSADLAGNLVPWTEDQDVAKDWSSKDEFTVVVRNKLTGHSGEGIVIIKPGEVVPEAPLYTKYVFKVKEFRVHVVNGKVIDTQQKIKDPDREVVTWKVRSHDNGFIYARGSIVADPSRDALAVAATDALGLDFGAVDIVQDKKDVLYVLEVNTAPGLEGQTVISYAEAFRAYSSET